MDDILFYVVFFFVLVVKISSQLTRESNYVQIVPCLNMMPSVTPNTTDFTVTSMLSCASRCTTSDHCQGFAYHGSTCRVMNILPDSSCQPSSHYPGSQAYEKVQPANTPVCQNGGTPFNLTHCICSGGYVGNTCQKVAKDCNEIISYGYYPSGEVLVKIEPMAGYSFHVLCDMDRNRLYIQKHFSIVSDLFYQNWDQYKLGFGNLMTISTDFWLGNDNIHRITRDSNYNLVIECALIYWAAVYAQVFNKFTVASAGENFRMWFEGSQPYPGNSGMGDGPMMQVNNTEFCTYDYNINYNNQPTSCGGHRKSGFWFCNNKCGEGNPNGNINPSDWTDYSNPNEAFWFTMEMYEVSPRYIQMWLEKAP